MQTNDHTKEVHYYDRQVAARLVGRELVKQLADLLSKEQVSQLVQAKNAVRDAQFELENQTRTVLNETIAKLDMIHPERY